MRMAEYSPDIIRFMMDASEYGTYHSELAAKLSAYIDAEDHVCDAGCGLGYLSLALSPYCKSVSAVDISSKALTVLRENIRCIGSRNIDVIEGDIEACLPGTPYNVMVFCFFGETDEALRIGKAQCRGRVILIKRDWEHHRFSLNPKPLMRHTLEQTCAELRERGIRFTCERLELEMGQPFRSLSDAAAFFRIYSDGESEQIAERDVESRLLRQDSEAFPYYLPSLKRMGIIVIDTGDIPGAKGFKETRRT